MIEYLATLYGTRPIPAIIRFVTIIAQEQIFISSENECHVLPRAANLRHKTMKIEGMSCMHCAGRVESALKAVPGVADAKVNLEKKEAVITLSENVPASKLMGAVEDAGYEPVSLS